MSVRVNDFKYIPGKNDAEYIKLLKEALERQKQITNKAIAKIKELSNCSEFPNSSSADIAMLKAVFPSSFNSQ